MKPQALCIKKPDLFQLLDRCGLPTSQDVIPLNDKQASYLLKNLNKMADELWYIPRSHCETDDNFRQLLPYVVVTDHNNNLVGYNRPVKGGGEGRLAGAFSIGIGGHVEPRDYNPNVTLGLYKAATREIFEELRIVIEGSEVDPEDELQLDLIGLIISDDSPVDSVHLGLVYQATFQERVIRIRSAEPDQIIDLRMLSLVQAGAEPNQESWTNKILCSGLLKRSY